ncbi:MAG: hypothetical protein C0601_06735 [Candidatus Muiribacterium halophilum]|uniref:DNA-directed RNA polymerase subunit alpha n=1 Tax=Muiribacterium halophilum TaxID=2053465 RepID=A0A2N5ZGE5_MUIH1|nr:MAG: hypothetical protein C0601_06735 [Candidatus Muirbacterium halophilum]
MINLNVPETVKYKTHSKVHCEYILEPIKKGYGETLGSFMKDLLINELEGYSPVSITFPDLDKKTKKLEGTEEQIIDIVMNIKNIICNVDDGEVYSRKIKFKGEKKVYAKDLVDDRLEIVNKDLYLFTVKKGKSFEIEIDFKMGHGYVLSYEHKKEKKVPYNKFYVDSFFSPVVFIDSKVKPIRLGGEMNHESLVVELKTNGTKDPNDAIADIAHMVVERLSIMAEKRERKPDPEPVAEEVVEEKDDTPAQPQAVEEETIPRRNIENLPVEEIEVMDLDLSQRAKNCIKNFQYRKLVDFTRVSADELMRLKNFGQKTLNEIREKLAEHSLTLRGETLE